MPSRLQTGDVLAVALLVLLALGLQAATGAYQTGLSAGASDEPAHYVSGVMVYDYLREAAPANPLRYAERYYLHYPAVAIGHWPPLLYVLQALWYFLFGSSLGAALALNGALTALAAALLFWIGKRMVGFYPALAAALVYVALPEVHRLSAHVMAEPLMMVLALAALERLAAHVREPSPRRLFAFSLLAAGAILTKAVAWCLAPLPLAVAVLSGRRQWLRTELFWSGQALVVLLCAPWELGVRSMVSAGFAAERQTLTGRGLEIVDLLAAQLGWPLLALAAVGWIIGLSRRRRSPQWCPYLLVIPAAIALAWLAPVALSARYLILAWPPALLLAALALQEIRERLRQPAWKPASAAALLLLAVPQLSLFSKRPAGFDHVVADLFGREKLADAVWLVSSEAGAEVLFVGESTRVENPPRRYILRASKYLAATSWMADGPYEPHVRSVEETAARLLEAPVGVLVLHQGEAVRPYLHHELLTALARQRPEVWRPVARYEVGGRRPGLEGAVEVFERVGRHALASGQIRLDMTRVLGKQLVAPVIR